MQKLLFLLLILFIVGCDTRGCKDTDEEWMFRRVEWRRHLDSLARSKTKPYQQYLVKYHCDTCPYKTVGFTNAWSGTNDGENFDMLDSAYLLKYGLIND